MAEWPGASRSTIRTYRCAGKAWPPGSYGWVAHRNRPQRHKNRRTTTSQLTSCLSTFQAQTTSTRVHFEKGHSRAKRMGKTKLKFNQPKKVSHSASSNEKTCWYT